MDRLRSFRLKYRQISEKLYGWPQTQVKIQYRRKFKLQALKRCVLPLCCVALSLCSPTVYAHSGTSSSLAEKALIPIILLLLAQVAIPAVRHILRGRAQKKAFIAYIEANVESTLARYGEERSLQSLLDNELKECPITPFWVERMQNERDSAPVLLLQMQLALEEAVTQEAHSRGYIPFLSYSGMKAGELDHSHPIWSMAKEEAKLVSDFLVSQAQVETSLNEQYSPPFFNLIKSDSYEQRHQWCAAGFVILDDLAEHYLNTLALKQHLDNKLK